MLNNINEDVEMNVWHTRRDKIRNEAIQDKVGVTFVVYKIKSHSLSSITESTILSNSFQFHFSFLPAVWCVCLPNPPAFLLQPITLLVCSGLLLLVKSFLLFPSSIGLLMTLNIPCSISHLSIRITVFLSCQIEFSISRLLPVENFFPTAFSPWTIGSCGNNSCTHAFDTCDSLACGRIDG
ncbi:hypothetical protein HAX54_026200 [Datura stramonium]|uniref:Uncharacterized protein n=1 Tax=Datura stramonium TaxID=4076 RepID=A0ABS8S776_DATST|nr:hypothetical protein [Datura stramonium]